MCAGTSLHASVEGFDDAIRVGISWRGAAHWYPVHFTHAVNRLMSVTVHELYVKRNAAKHFHPFFRLKRILFFTRHGAQEIRSQAVAIQQMFKSTNSWAFPVV